MSAVRAEPADVWLNGGRPARFVWRGRLYTVLAIVERPGGDPGARWLCWRVTASPARNVPAVEFRLCHDNSRERWYLSRDRSFGRGPRCGRGPRAGGTLIQAEGTRPASPASVPPCAL